jgi:hypothetical protein
MSDSNDEHNEFFSHDVVNNAISPYARPIAWLAVQFLASGGKRI